MNRAQRRWVAQHSQPVRYVSDFRDDRIEGSPYWGDIVRHPHARLLVVDLTHRTIQAAIVGRDRVAA